MPDASARLHLNGAWIIFSIEHRDDANKGYGLSYDEWKNTNIILYHLRHTRCFVVAKCYGGSGVPSHDDAFIRNSIQRVFNNDQRIFIDHVHAHKIGSLAYDVVIPRDQLTMLRLSASSISSTQF